MRLVINTSPSFFTMLFLPLASLLGSAVILPTIWRYLQILEAPPYFLGLGLSAFSLSGLLTDPLFGFWSDRSKKTKSIILFANFFQIVGELSNHKIDHMTQSDFTVEAPNMM